MDALNVATFIASTLTLLVALINLVLFRLRRRHAPAPTPRPVRNTHAVIDSRAGELSSLESDR